MESDNFRVRFTSAVMVITVIVCLVLVARLHFVWLGMFTAGIAVGSVIGNHFGYYHGRFTLLNAELKSAVRN